MNEFWQNLVTFVVIFVVFPIWTLVCLEIGYRTGRNR